MVTKEFTFYICTKDRQSEQLVMFVYENLKDIKQRGFPKPVFVKLTKKQIIKHKDNLMNSGIRKFPSIVFNGNVYAGDEIKSLLHTNLVAKAKKIKKEDEDLREYYKKSEYEYQQDLPSSYKLSRGYQSDEEPFSKEDLDKQMKSKNFKAYGDRYKKEEREEEQDSNTVQGSFTKDTSDEEVQKPKNKPKKKNKKNKKEDSDSDSNPHDYLNTDDYYADMALQGGEFD